MGYRERRHRGFAFEGVTLSDAGRICEGDHAGQAGDEKHVRMSSLQDQNTRPYVRLDVEFQDPRQADQVDLGRRRDSPADLTELFSRRGATVRGVREATVRSHAISRS